MDARPSTDNKTDFEDLILFAINYGQVSGPERVQGPVAASEDRLALSMPSRSAIGETFAVSLAFQGTGAVQGLSVQLAFDPATVEFLGVDRGALLDGQRAPATVLSARAGNVDVVTLGHGAGIRGSGELASARFRVKAAGDPSIHLERVSARDGRNTEVPLALASGVGGAALATTAIARVYPNPMREGVTVQWSLTRAGAAHLAIYDLAGRRVRMLAEGDFSAGVRSATWDGRNDLGQHVRAGFYALRLRAGGVTETRTLRMVP